MSEQCRNCEGKEQACVPFFLHENALMHCNRVNRRMMIIHIVSIIIIVVGMAVMGWMFLSSYNSREKGWQEIVQQRLTEVEDGVHQQPD